MKPLLSLTVASLRHRRASFGLAVFSVAISVILLLGIDRTRRDFKNHFLHTVSHTDLIAAAPSGDIETLLGLVFHLGDDRTRIAYDDFLKVRQMPRVAWCVPIARGDSLHGFDVIGTDTGYFARYRYGDNRPLRFAAGKPFVRFYDAVLGSDVADALHLHVGDTLIIAHGHGAHAHAHARRPFRVSGILAPTLTPNDRSVFVRLDALEAIHVEWRSGRFVDMHLSADELRHLHVKPTHLSGMLIGLRHRSDVLAVKDAIDRDPQMKLRAVIPAAALAKLWRLLDTFERVLYAVSAAVFLAALLGLTAVLLGTLEQRRREMAVLRTLGARPVHIFTLLMLEAAGTVTLGIAAGVFLLELLTFAADTAGAGLPLSYAITPHQLGLLALLLFSALFAGTVPAFGAYRRSLKDGMAAHV